MIAHVKTCIFLIFILILGGKLNAKAISHPEYLKYVNEIAVDFAKTMEKKYDLHFSGNGGRMPTDVEEIEVSFISYQKLTVDDARKMEVTAIQELLKRINSHEKIRPYLREYPFDSSRVNILISFRTETDDRPIDGSVALIFLARNKIFYRSAEIQIDEPTPLVYMNDKKEIVREWIGGGPEEKLIPLMDETYEEALKIVNAAAQADLDKR